jgi:outer membrane protein OmpA-like peptidoglycan-associated protein
MRVLQLTIFVALLAVLFGCSTRLTCVYQSDPAEQLSKSQIDLLSKRLTARNVRIIRAGGSIILVLSNKAMFNSDSANFSNEAYGTLDLIGDFISYYDKSTASVVGFTRDRAVDALSKSIATERANRVARYLWKLGINARFMYADGKTALASKGHKVPLSDCADCVVINFFVNLDR